MKKVSPLQWASSLIVTHMVPPHSFVFATHGQIHNPLHIAGAATHAFSPEMEANVPGVAAPAPAADARTLQRRECKVSKKRADPKAFADEHRRQEADRRLRRRLEKDVRPIELPSFGSAPISMPFVAAMPMEAMAAMPPMAMAAVAPMAAMQPQAAVTQAIPVATLLPMPMRIGGSWAAGGAASGSGTAAGGTTAPDITAQIEKLHSQHRRGIIDDDEYKAAKALLLGMPMAGGIATAASVAASAVAAATAVPTATAPTAGRHRAAPAAAAPGTA